MGRLLLVSYALRQYIRGHSMLDKVIRLAVMVDRLAMGVHMVVLIIKVLVIVII